MGSLPIPCLSAARYKYNMTRVYRLLVWKTSVTFLSCKRKCLILAFTSSLRCGRHVGLAFFNSILNHNTLYTVMQAFIFLHAA